MTPNTLLAQLHWRYSTKKFDPARKIPSELWSALEQALVLTPSSYGLQPWKFFVIDDPQMRQRLRDASWNQPQVTEASHFVVFAYKKDLGAKDIEHYIQRMAQVRSIEPSSLAELKKVLLDFAAKTGGPDLYEWARKQVYLALGNFLISTAVLGIDACPMEGIEPGKYDEILGLQKKGYYTTCAAAAGYRSADDPYAGLAKVRFPIKEIIEHI